jgi:cold shock CspA family protein
MKVHGIEIKAALTGVVAKWWKSQGVGYVQGDADADVYFVPAGTLPDGYAQLRVGQRVQFASDDGETARITALLFH